MILEIYPGNERHNSLSMRDLRSISRQLICFPIKSVLSSLCEEAIKLPILLGYCVITKTLLPKIIEFLFTWFLSVFSARKVANVTRFFRTERFGWSGLRLRRFFTTAIIYVRLRLLATIVGLGFLSSVIRLGWFRLRIFLKITTTGLRFFSCINDMICRQLDSRCDHQEFG